MSSKKEERGEVPMLQACSVSWFLRMQLFPFTLCNGHSRSAMLVPCICLLCFSSLYYYLFFFSLSAGPRQPHRTAFHFQPPKNWMNDPNGPMFYKGYYHLFYQWNPFAAVWGNITWGHAVSKDLIHWHHLELALVPDQWYDMYGCWTGSATFVDNGKPVLIYTGWSNASSSPDRKVQMQSMAMPENYSDPLLRKWVKAPQNPILTAPKGTDSNSFRDPTTAWMGTDGKWRMLIGSQNNGTGLALLYRSSDFLSWEKAIMPLHSVESTGMWECPDFYPVPTSGKNGLNNSLNGVDVRHVLKVSFIHDFYAVGIYVASNDSFFPAHANLDAGIGLQYDYGKYYASKSFYDDNKGRRIIFGWVNESDGEKADIAKGWASVQAIPRVVWLDPETNYSLLQWPIEEVESLRRKSILLDNQLLDKGSVLQVKGIKGPQLDIDVAFELPELNQAEVINVDAADAQLLCSEKGTSRDGILGPFGILVLASNDQVEQTAIFFFIGKSKDGWKALVCSDQSRSSLDINLDKTSYGSFFSISKEQTSLHLRILVDRSIIEIFAQGGKVCICTRVYPTRAIDQAAFLFIFNNGTVPIHMKSFKAWELTNVKMDTL